MQVERDDAYAERGEKKAQENEAHCTSPSRRNIRARHRREFASVRIKMMARLMARAPRSDPLAEGPHFLLIGARAVPDRP